MLFYVVSQILEWDILETILLSHQSILEINNYKFFISGDETHMDIKIEYNCDMELAFETVARTLFCDYCFDLWELLIYIIGFNHGLPCCVKNMARGTQVDKNRGRRPRFLSWLRPEGYVFNIAWQAMIKTYYSMPPFAI